MPIHQGQTLRFGPFTLDPRCGELRTNGSRIKLQGQPIQVLELLLEKPGELVTREEIRQKLWSSDTFVDFDHNLNTAIKKLRQALGDEADTPHFIETVPKYGYRFIGEVATDVTHEGSPAQPHSPIPEALPTTAPQSLPSPQKHHRVIWIAAVFVAALLLVSFAALQLRRRPEAMPRVVLKSQLQLRGTGACCPSVSRNGRYLAYIGGPSNQIWLKDLQDGSDEPLAGTESVGGMRGIDWLIWSPDSRYIGFFSSKLKKIALDSRIVTEITDLNNSKFATWGTSGIILANGAKGFKAVNVDTGKQWLVFPPPASWIDSFPVFLPDGKHFLFVRYPVGRYFTRGGSGILYVGTLDGGQPRSLDVRVTGYARYAAGHILYTTQHGLLAQRFDVSGLRVLGEPTLLIASTGTGGIGFTASDNGILISVTNSGFYQGESELRLYSRNGKPLNEPFTQGFPDFPRFSPDGKRIAYDQIMGENQDIWIFDLERRVNTQITLGDATYRGPVWSPDGKRIAYSYGSQNQRGMAIRNMDGSGKPEMVFQTRNEDTLNYWVRSWSPVGNCLIITVTEFGGDRKIGTLCLDGDRKLNLLPVPRTNSQSPMISPDGKWLAYVSNEIFLEKYPGPSVSVGVSTGGGRAPQWRRDGRELFFASHGKVMAASLTYEGSDVKVGEVTELFTLPPLVSGIALPFDASPDGQSFVLNNPRAPIGSSDIFDVMTNWDLVIKKPAKE